MATDPTTTPTAEGSAVTFKHVGLRARDLLVGASAEDEVAPRLIIESFEGVDVPFDRLEWRDRTLRLVKRRMHAADESAA